MKPFSVLVITLFSCSVLQAQNKTSDQEAIRKVIDMESQYFFAGNYDKWAGTWAHEPTSYWTYASPDFHNEVIGWDNIAEGMKYSISHQEKLLPTVFFTTKASRTIQMEK